jgi:hypothetical protein
VCGSVLEVTPTRREIRRSALWQYWAVDNVGEASLVVVVQGFEGIGAMAGTMRRIGNCIAGEVIAAPGAGAIAFLLRARFYSRIVTAFPRYVSK